jgi:ParB family chromosome partitioning protein
VRKTNAAMSIEALAESIARRSLLQSLSVRPLRDDAGQETGTYEVQAGQRRLRALHLLVKSGRLAADAPIPCVVKTTGMLEDDSLAENSDRQALHPLDQFRAFAALRENGMPEEDVAAAYAVTPTIVRQRLKLAAASPALLDAYAAEEITLEQLMAFCITDDHARQDDLWLSIRRGQVHPAAHTIRRLLTEDTIPASDARVRFIGADAYIAAGGTITRDLFSNADESYLQDAALVTRLVAEKLEAVRQEHLDQGWKWAEAAIDLPYNATSGMRRLQPSEVPLSRKEQKHYDKLVADLDQLREEYDQSEDNSEETERRIEALETQVEAIDRRPPHFDKHDMARAGVMIDLDTSGLLNIRYGLIRREDEPQQPSEAHPASATGDVDGAGEQTETITADDADLGTELSMGLVQDLTSYRTIALRDAMAQNFDVAFLAVLHAMCLTHFNYYGSRNSLQLTVRSHFPDKAPGLEEMDAAKSVAARHDAWQQRLPEAAEDLWETLVTFGPDDRADLFAHCASLTVNAVRERHSNDRERLRHADQLATSLGLDVLRAGWAPTVETYFGRVTKTNILQAVREAKDERSAQLIDHLKKQEMAKEAQRLVAGTGWLPELLRAPESWDQPVTTHASTESLPDFLAETVGDDDVEAAA